LSVYQGEVGIPINGFFEVAAQATFIHGDGVATIFGEEDMNGFYLLSAGAMLRIFPMQNAAGFFVTGRLEYLGVGGDDIGTDEYSDFAAGIDLGWRFRWWIDDNWGIIFQLYAGITRAITSEEIGQWMTVIPFGSLHVGVCF